MIKEVDLFGIYAPPMFAYAAAAAVIWIVLRWVLREIGFYRLVWHQALFNVALYVLVLSACISLVFR
ncbi:DUF1656 domain-containing protein [Microvirga subterranea]|uniref:Uncharacterized protein DUF1656 n=1 Tax=Microvirga subterranea TaxID=186651 RepID=A0A370HL84_9HYPH|nr:DUF1656 domain-containing protein [Microvirga subterranea]RDI59110.1 uncharacterized protein DUF1656 [Microvirga subterranea]